jgi:hypothetical protein
MQGQFKMTLALIACAAVIALICDFLKVRTAQLRPDMPELKPRNQPRNLAGAVEK